MTATTIARPTRLLALPAWIGRHKALIAFCALVGVYYLWTVSSSGGLFAFNKNNSDYYNLLSDGFLGGHLHLLVPPSPDLLALPDPYDPVANAPYRLHDLSLYHDKYYLYWGPTPALLLFIPFRLLPLGDLPQTLAVFLFSFVGFCFSLASLRVLARRFTPDVPRWMLGAAGLALAAGNALPYTMRRAGIYEVAITAGFCLLFIALYLLLTGLLDGPRPRRLALASLFVGLAVGARPTMLVGVIALVVVAFVLVRRTSDRREQGRLVALLLGPAAAVGVALVAYNVARFGSPLEFGTTYQLAGTDQRDRRVNQPAYVPPGLWYYLISRPHLTAGFPFVHLAPPPAGSYPFTPPEGYDGVEPVGGLFVTVPFTLLVLAIPFALRGQARRVALGLAGCAALVVFMTSLALWGATMRYEVDFATLALLAAALVWFTLAAKAGGWRRRVVVWGGTALVAWGVAFGIAVGFTGYYNSLRTYSPGTFLALQKLTSPLATVIARVDGPPKITDVWPQENLAADTDLGPGFGTLGMLVSPKPLELSVISGSYQRAGLVLSAGPMPGADPATTPPATALTIATPDTHRTLKLPGQFGAFVAPLSLRRGLNRIVITATGGVGAISNVQLTDPPPTDGP